MSSYWDDVKGMAESLVDEIPNMDRDEWLQHMNESIDGSSTVIYTHEAKKCLNETNNETAGIDSLGADGFDYTNGIPWSAFAYFAFEADVLEEIDRLGVDVNDDDTFGPEGSEAELSEEIEKD